MLNLLLLLISMAANAQDEDCAEPTVSTQLTAAIREAEGTFSDLDIPAFKVATDRLHAIIPCLKDPNTRNVAAEVHRMTGMRAFGDRDTDKAKLAFAAARSIEPYYEFPETLIPRGNPVRKLYADLELGKGAARDVAKPAVGYIQFDGRTTLKRPVTWPTFMQRFDDGGQVIVSAYLWPDDPTPKYAVSTAVAVADPDAYVPPEPTPARVPLLIATASTAVVTGALYGLAGSAEAKFKSPQTPDNELDGFEKRANTLVVVSGVTGAVTVGLGIGFATTF